MTGRRLTDYAECAGCASKLDASSLRAITCGLPTTTDPRVLVDFETGDDAGVFRWSNGHLLIHTVDFFTPIVDDPFVFGQIAAVNAVSDVYAMGGTPRTALAIAAFPKKNGPDRDAIRAIFRGGAEALRDMGVALLGGHTVTDPEIKFGYAVTGEVEDEYLLTNAGARPGDILFLTKPLGTGIVARAHQRGRASEHEMAVAVASMLVPNTVGRSLAVSFSSRVVHACTDVTGFGLVGHASAMAVASGVTLEFESEHLPVLPGALAMAARDLPCGGRANLHDFQDIQVETGVAPERHLVACDPQTSGGLLVAVAPEQAAHVYGHLTEQVGHATVVGRVREWSEGQPRVRLYGIN